VIKKTPFATEGEIFFSFAGGGKSKQILQFLRYN
jgi:hypothetical protein